MNLDQYGLPVQADGDANDQLQRCGMIVVGSFLGRFIDGRFDGIWLACQRAVDFSLQPSPGIFTRYIGAPTDNVSADQLISALAAQVYLGGRRRPTSAMLKTCLKRFGFAQNWRTLNGEKKFLPDFMLARALPLFTRLHWSLYPLTYIADLYLLLLVIGDWVYQKTDKDPADVNNTLLTLAVCRRRMPTLVSILSCKLWGKLRDINAAMARYHRAESLGNPEIAELWKPTVDSIFY